jgi:hypothetical protein
VAVTAPGHAAGSARATGAEVRIVDIVIIARFIGVDHAVTAEMVATICSARIHFRIAVIDPIVAFFDSLIHVRRLVRVAIATQNECAIMIAIWCINSTGVAFFQVRRSQRGVDDQMQGVVMSIPTPRKSAVIVAISSVCEWVREGAVHELALFTKVIVQRAVSAGLVRHAVLAAAIRRDCIAVVTDFSEMHIDDVVAADLCHAIGITAVSRRRVAVVAGLAEVPH